MARRAPFLLSLALAAPLSAQTPQEITAEGLGYTPPVPVESLTPVDGFRTRDSLEARFLELALGAEHIARHEVGASVFDREIFAYTIGAGTETDGGQPRPAAFLLGGAHAREWASHEVAADILEWFALEAPEDVLGGYLLDTMHIVVVPVSNPDGFVKTQNHPTTTIFGGDTGWGGRDGRMRRKNLRNSTETLDPPAGYLNGVDLNRNFPVGWGGTASPTSITYGGTEPGSEPETAAVQVAEDLLGVAQLRLFIDYHSFGQFHYVVQTGDPMDTATGEAYGIMRDASEGETGAVYTRSNWLVPAMSIGASDEYFATRYGAMAYTAETRPRRVDSPNPFILPDDQVDAARREMRAATLGALYYASGPAWLEQVEFRDTTEVSWPDAPAVHRETRRPGPDPSARVRIVDVGEPLLPGRVYTARLRFNKPMRGAGGGPLLAGFEADAPEVLLGGVFVPEGVSWQEGNTLEARWEIPAAAAGPQELVLSVHATDGVDTALDGAPDEAARWDGLNGWTGWTREPDEWTTVAFEGISQETTPEVWVFW